MTLISCRWLWQAHCEGRHLFCHRTEANTSFKDFETTQNLILSPGYNDFKSNGSSYVIDILFFCGKQNKKHEAR